MIYPWIWDKLPGGRLTRTVCAILLLAAAGGFLWYVLFPLADSLFGLDEVTVEPSAGQP
ncbi:hypothetical protein Aph01nite_01590 [Acrocarpospora phusangensis]|uniref:Uncharacterized protein n=1 Tax=Acrocarpospora phusangensis TaxID=1070424 RepID=A0A919Q5Y6_9ACTN|nr:hypothetical protein [Acrocarpospora phusangensis]GIH21849.1 hypothetical protein Aph01nite_01590 [Acrocarpospora phusangensis]